MFVKAGGHKLPVGLRKLGDADARPAVFGKDPGLAAGQRSEVRGGEADGPVLSVCHTRHALSFYPFFSI